MKPTKKHPGISIRKIARIEDRATGKYFEVIEFPISDSKTGRLELVPSVINDLDAFGKRLRDAGAVLPKDDSKLRSLLTVVAKSDAPEDWIYEAHTGWVERRRAFVTRSGVIGQPSGKIVGINLANPEDDPSGQLSASGTWRSWRETVAKPARDSSILMLAICLPLAAPLLRIMNRPSFTICLSSRTRTGKSIATLVGGSVIGIARSADLITWNLTDAHLEQRLAEHNDGLFPIDDFMTMRGTDRERYQRIRGVAYKLTQGWVTGRHESFTKAHKGTHSSWRCIALTSSEKPICAFAKTVKLEREYGEALRLIDQPAVFDGLDHIFDLLAPVAQPPTWKSDAFASIARACELNHGKAFEKYIESLIAEEPKVAQYVERRITGFVGHVCDQFDGDVARDVAEKYGLIYAGGMLGIRFGLLPWEKRELREATAKCYRYARELLPDDGVVLRRGIQALETRLRSLPTSSSLAKRSVAEGSFKEAEGYRETKVGVYRCRIRCEVFNSIFSSTSERDLVLNWLLLEGRITTSVSKTASPTSRSIPKKQFEWPDGERHRSFEIHWPRG